MRVKAITYFGLIFIGFVIYQSASAGRFKPCFLDQDTQKNRSEEIHQIYLADQKDRENFDDMNNEERQAMSERDTKRRMRIGEIFAEGCVNQGSDYYDAAMIFQHGDVPDHYFQAFYFANKAENLGYSSAKWLKAAAIDRYLVSIDHKQLFATQFFSSEKTNGCFCLQPVENSFPENLRVEATGKSINEVFDRLDELNKGNNKNCPKEYCPADLKPTPRGTVIGFW